MKVLAIRGENLASLSGGFEIDFESDPLKSSGLFAICGPTGSGKSTLLDALCLALYNKTPRLRLANAKGIKIRDVGEENLSQNDPRNLLRRGSSQAHAEVDFVGSDATAYRARWSVRRARGRSSGRMQQVEMSLLRLDDLQPIGSTNNEVLPEIEKRLGLNFEQFTRGVLLAQNEFSSFLKARDDERASLLETLTGTDIYSQISSMTFDRAKREQQQLDELKGRLADRTPLDREQRQALEQELRQALEAQTEREKQHRAAQATLSWFTTLKELHGKEQQAQQSLAEQQHAHADAQPQREHLQLLSAVESSRPLLQEQARLEASLQQLQSSLADARQEQQRLEALGRQQKSALADAETAQKNAQQARQASIPLLQQARKLDALSQSLAEEIAQQRQLVDGCDQETQLHQQQVDKQQQEQTLLQARHQQLENWLEQHQGLQPLAEGWSGWQQRLEDAERLLRQVDQLQQDRLNAQTRLEQTEAEHQRTTEQFARVETQILAQEMEITALQAAMGDQDLQALNEEKDRAEYRRRQLNDACVQLQTLERLEEAQALHRNEQAQQDAELRRLQEDISALEPALEASCEEERQTRIALDRARLAQAQNVQTLRRQLEPDTPCPVCGSPDHPYLANAPRDGDALLATLEQQWQQARSANDANLKSLQRATTAQEQLLKVNERLSHSRKALESEYRQAQEGWHALAATAALVQMPERPRSEQLRQLLSEQEQRIHTLSGQVSALSRQQARRDQLQQTLRQAQSGLRQCDQQHQQAELALEKQRAEIDALLIRQRESGLQLEERLNQLQPVVPFAGWQTQWRAAPAAYASRLTDDVHRWLQQVQTREEQQQSLQRLEQSLTMEQRLLTKAQHQQKSEQAQLDQLQQRFDAQQAERAQLFGGEPADQVETRLDAALSESSNACEAARQDLQTTKEQQSAINARLTSEMQTEQQLTLQRQRAADALLQWLGDFNAQGAQNVQDTKNAQSSADATLSLDQLRCLLDEDSRHREQQAEKLAALDRQLEKAQVLAAERRERRLEHEATRERQAEDNDAAPLDEPAAIQQEQTLAEALKAARARHSELTHRLRSDDEKREAADEISQRIDEQAQRCRVWQQLNELIGSGDGRKFRNYAQQLTLDMLLKYANRHLRNLADRYRLGRVDDSLALQVIDRDMGDEVRSVHSLSGGESFLVSLALALGLASLSSNQVRVESLFIDEGFGSLDEETLRVAMEALDSLQAQGRKVGVITHVQEMIERITTQVQVNKRQPGSSTLTVVG